MTPKARIRYPRIPRELEGPGGTITIVLADGVRHENEECWGLYDPGMRRITLDKNATPAQRWRTLFHELVHVALIDAGLNNGMSDAMHEAICDSIATARMRERFG